MIIMTIGFDLFGTTQLLHTGGFAERRTGNRLSKLLCGYRLYLRKNLILARSLDMTSIGELPSAAPVVVSQIPWEEARPIFV
jgi:hypothetical protein